MRLSKITAGAGAALHEDVAGTVGCGLPDGFREPSGGTNTLPDRGTCTHGLPELRATETATGSLIVDCRFCRQIADREGAPGQSLQARRGPELPVEKCTHDGTMVLILRGACHKLSAFF